MNNLGDPLCSPETNYGLLVWVPLEHSLLACLRVISHKGGPQMDTGQNKWTHKNNSMGALGGNCQQFGRILLGCVCFSNTVMVILAAL